MLVDFDPNASWRLRSWPQAAYAANPIPELPASQFRVVADRSSRPTPARTARCGRPDDVDAPASPPSYKLGEKTVLKGGYGIYYDTLNAADYNPNHTGYNVTTTNTNSTDFGRTWLRGSHAGELAFAESVPAAR